MNITNYSNAFKTHVADKYNIFKSLFASLPFSGVANAGAMLPILYQNCVEGFKLGKSPKDIIDYFFSRQFQQISEAEKMDVLFKLVQYIEREVVLFDAVEDAAFSSVTDTQGAGTLKSILNQVEFASKNEEFVNKINQFKVRVVLTAHPTQFYPGTVLGIIHDLSNAIGKNDLGKISSYIQQLGLTPFFNKQKPTPFDEATNLIWYLENVFYTAIGKIYNQLSDLITTDNPLVELGFWPGGDRDGNAFVTSEVTLKVAAELSRSIVVCYYRDVRRLSRLITFRDTFPLLKNIEERLYKAVFLDDNNNPINGEQLLSEMEQIRNSLVQNNHSLYVKEVNEFINKIKVFGVHFATLDIRQDSRIHTKVLNDVFALMAAKGKPLVTENYDSLSETEKIDQLCKIQLQLNPDDFEDDITKETLKSIYALIDIQKKYTEKACNRYIISNCQSALNVMQVHTLFRCCGLEAAQIHVDIVPLFETIDDLSNSQDIMSFLYHHSVYGAHLKRRKKRQDIMLGFSDGTKDGGYLQANLSIYYAKEQLTALSRSNEIEVVFFDGRGGPPSRGGGKTHKYYTSMGSSIENRAIQLTVQGQTITSNFGTVASAQYNLEQLLSAGIASDVFQYRNAEIKAEYHDLMHQLADISHQKYVQLKENPLFLKYLEKHTPLNFYGDSNIASRPTKRKVEADLQLGDLRAIPFVGSWSQVRQNVPGFYGLGFALEQMIQNEDQLQKLQNLYKEVPFFRSLMENSMMSLQKSWMPLTEHLRNDTVFGAFWTEIYEEYERSVTYILKIAQADALMPSDPVDKSSILLRDKIMLPLSTIQQYALTLINESKSGLKIAQDEKNLEKLITRSMFGIINASRNSA